MTRTPEGTMLTVLLESRATRQRHVGGTTASTLVHVAVIVAVALTLPDDGGAKLTPDVHATKVTFVRTSPPATHSAPSTPRSRSSTNDAAPRPDIRIIDVPPITPKSIPPIDLSQPNVTSDQVLIGRGVRPIGSRVGGPGVAVGGTG